MATRAGWLYYLLVLALLAGGVVLRIADPFFMQALRLIAFDSYQRAAPEAYDPNLPVRVVDIDEESLARIGQWPWPRTVLADLLVNLSRQGAAVVAFDILFAEPDQTSPEEAIKRLNEEDREAVEAIVGRQDSHDSILAEAIAAGGTVLSTALTGRPSAIPPAKAGFVVAGDDPRPFIASFAGATRNLEILDDAAAGIGAINWTPDRDQVIRRVPLIFRVGEEFVPSLATEALRAAEGASTYVLKASNASGETAWGEETGLNHIRVGSFDIPTDADGVLWLKFRPANPQAYIPAWAVLAGENDATEVAGRIMLIGTSAPGLIDLRATPLDPSIAGVEVHAQVIEHIVSGRSITRPDYALALEIAIFVCFGLAIAFVLPRISAGQAAVLGFSAIAAIIFGGWLVYSQAGLLLDPSSPALALLILVASATLYIYRRVEMQRAEVRRAFSHYVSPSVVDEIIAHPERLELGGVERDLTLLFCDVRNFTAISERLSATELTRFINSLLTPLTDIILKNRGTIDKYMGDAIMAFWNAPLDDPDHAANACRSAAEMVAAIAELNRHWQGEAAAAGRPFVPVAIGIGVNSGECLVGNLGSDQRFDYSALGDEVNVASRLEGLSKHYGIAVVVGEPTMLRQPTLAVLELDLMRVVGRTQPTRLYTLADTLGADPATFGRLEPVHRAMLEAFRGRTWDRAEELIGECRKVGIVALEAYYDVFSARIALCGRDPPGEDWDGVFTAETK
jgi:adenylate cyclase